MRHAYQLLADEFSNDDQCYTFIHSAWTSWNDYTTYRDQLKSAEELNKKIANAAVKLVKLIDEFLETGVNAPGEFYSVRELLQKTENKALHEHDVNMWRVMRETVLGELPLRDISESDLEQPQENCDTGSAPEIDQEEKMRKSIRYGWENAPSLSALLETVAKAAREFKPNEYGMIGAAINRQRNPKNEYLRAFISLLIDDNQLTLTPHVMRAMEIVANVVIHSPDDIVSLKDVQNMNKELIERRRNLMAIGDVMDGEPIKTENDTSYERLMAITSNMEMKKRAGG